MPSAPTLTFACFTSNLGTEPVQIAQLGNVHCLACLEYVYSFGLMHKASKILYHSISRLACDCEYVLSMLDVMGVADATNGLQMPSETVIRLSSYVIKAFT